MGVQYYLTGSSPGPVVNAPVRTSLISQVGSPDVRRYNTRHPISKSKGMSLHLHQGMYGTLQ